MKCVMIINQDLPVGLMANTAAVLALTIGHRIDGIIGKDVADSDGEIHTGIAQVPAPLLKGDSDLIRATRAKPLDMDPGQVFFVDVCDFAQLNTPRRCASGRTSITWISAADSVC
jgi:hypothetical protein